jgi:hypothetical protein
MTTEYYGFSDDMFTSTQRVGFHSFKTGQHKFRLLPPYAPGKMYEQIGLHWGFTDENNKVKALKCTKFSHKSCPICDEVDRLNGQIEMIKTGATAYPNLKAAEEAITDIMKRVGDIKRKPTYLWNILTDGGEQKVLSLSWNGHDPLHTKVKYFWEQKKINVTNPNENYLMFCERSGQAAKTRYVYEVLDNSIKKLEGLSPLIDLSKVYRDYTPSELRAILEQGYASAPTEDPNDRNFAAQMPSGLDQKPVEQPQQSAASSVAQQNNFPVTPPPTNAIQPTTAVNDTVAQELANMKALLQD